MDYGTVSVSNSILRCQWPEKLGGNDISVLRDSLLNFAYGDTVSTSVRDAVVKFLSDTSMVAGALNIAPVDTLPADSMTYFTSVTASVTDLDEEMVAYQVVTSQYLGGAHPLTTSHPFTFDSAEGKVLDNSNIFLPGTPTDSIMPVITEALARQLGVSGHGGLTRRSVRRSQADLSGQAVYIEQHALFSL